MIHTKKQNDLRSTQADLSLFQQFHSSIYFFSSASPPFPSSPSFLSTSIDMLLDLLRAPPFLLGAGDLDLDLELERERDLEKERDRERE